MLQAVADRFERSLIQRYLFLTVATLFTIAFVGYHFGTFDQDIHLPSLKKFADPLLFPTDPFLDLRMTHYSYFWFLLLPFYQAGILELVMFVAHVLVTFATFWCIWALSDSLFHNPLTCIVSVITFAFPHVGFAGFPVIEFSLLNRTFVLPFLLFSMWLYLRQRYVLAYGILGLMYNLHVLSVNYVLAMFLLDGLLQWRKNGWRTLLQSLIVFVIMALPVLLWRQRGSGLDLSLRPDWLSIIARGIISNYFYFLAPFLPILFFTLSGISALILFGISKYRSQNRPHDRTTLNFIAALVIMLVIQVITAEWLPITFIVELQFMRAGVFLVIWGYLYFAHFLVEAYQSQRMSQFDFGVLAGALAVSIFAFVPLAIYTLRSFITNERLKKIALVTFSLVLATSNYGVAMYYRVWYPGIYVFPHTTPWYDVQNWARENTPKETLFITPPHKWGFYESGWRDFSERSTVVTFFDLIEVGYAPEYLQVWAPRFEQLAPGAQSRFRGDYFENNEIVARAYYQVSEEGFARLGKQYGASYVVLEKPNRRGFPVVYENSEFIVQRLPGSQ